MKINETKEGALIGVFVKPNQPKFKITIENDEILISSTQEPVKGKVNKEITKELSRLFHAKVELASGSTSRHKTLLIKNIKKPKQNSFYTTKAHRYRKYSTNTNVT